MSSQQKRGKTRYKQTKNTSPHCAIRAQEELARKALPCLALLFIGMALGLQLPWGVSEGRYFSLQQHDSLDQHSSTPVFVTSAQTIPVISEQQTQDISSLIEPPPPAMQPLEVMQQHIDIEPILVENLSLPALPPYTESSISISADEFTQEAPSNHPPSKKQPQRTQERKRMQAQALASNTQKTSTRKPQTTSSSGLIAKTRPSYRSAPKPPFPASMRSRQAEGTVRVRISVDAKGKPTEVSIVNSSGYHELDSTARHWILSRWSFFPATENGSAIASRVTTQIVFSLDT